jgi:dTDP-4-amino-4,6-dideoxygalactose transaminase
MVDEERSPYSRNGIMERLQEMGVSTRPGTHAVHMLNHYSRKFGINPSDYSGAMAANDLSMAIPLHNRMTSEDYHYVVEALKSL